MHGDSKSSRFFVSEEKLCEESLRRIYSFGITTVQQHCQRRDVTLKRPTIFRFSFPHKDCSTEIKREDIIRSLITRKIVIFQEMSSMNVDYFRYLVLAGNFLNFRPYEIQLGTQCLWAENGPLMFTLVNETDPKCCGEKMKDFFFSLAVLVKIDRIEWKRTRCL